MNRTHTGWVTVGVRSALAIPLAWNAANQRKRRSDLDSEPLAFSCMLSTRAGFAESSDARDQAHVGAGRTTLS